MRKGYINLKSATPKAGYLGKQVAGALHELRVGQGKPMPGTGLPVDVTDPDNEGSVLARDVDGIPAGTILTTKLLKRLARKSRRILVHSPISSFANEPGIPRVALGIREGGRLPAPGEFVGISAAQAITEPLAQSAISAKHVAGVVGASGGGSSAETSKGFDAIEKFVNTPKHYPGKAAVADLDGTVTGIQDAPQGGKYIYIAGQQHYAPHGYAPQVKPGQRVEAGDVLSEGLPDPANLAKHKGIGEGRRLFLQRFHDMLRESGIKVNRRNSELAATGLVRHVRLLEEDGRGGLPDDIVEYEEFAHRYVPRQGAKITPTASSKGMYLEQPTLHYSIGTRVTPSVLKTLKEFDVDEVFAHPDTPPFEPAVQRAVDSLAADSDWKVNLAGFGLSKNLQQAVHRGASSSARGLSYIPGLASSLSITDLGD